MKEDGSNEITRSRQNGERNNTCNKGNFSLYCNNIVINCYSFIHQIYKKKKIKMAFGLVDQKCLLHKLERYGVRGPLSYNWFLDYLCTRSCVYNCLVLPVLCYTDTAWGELSVECKSRLRRLQNRAARIIVRRDSTSEAIKTLGWPNLETFRKRNKAILVYKCLNDLVPQYLSDY